MQRIKTKHVSELQNVLSTSLKQMKKQKQKSVGDKHTVGMVQNFQRGAVSKEEVPVQLHATCT
jgi:hypothetical protein